MGKWFDYLLATKIATIKTAAHNVKPITQKIRLRQFVFNRLSFVTYNFSPLYNNKNASIKFQFLLQILV